MSKIIKLIWQCVYSPRLYSVYRAGEMNSVYRPNELEDFGDKVFSIMQIIFSFITYTSPFIGIYIYKRDFFTWDETKFLGKVTCGFICVIIVSFLIRAIGRASNLNYREFLITIQKPNAEIQENIHLIRQYDFEFSAWPVTFAMPESQSMSWLDKFLVKKCANADLPTYQRIPLQILAFVAVHTFAMRIIYPGTLSLIQSLYCNYILGGRSHLVETYHGKRAKILTSDANSVDTMFVDNRNHTNGNILVICCEGNSGFYELGIISTPINSGFSALGWNHPGFAGSTGIPFPKQEQNSINAVIQYAIEELNFPIENIVLYGWSIGGYTAAWGAVNYPGIKALILDATFDDMLPLAQKQMPRALSLLVKEVIRTYVDLNVGELLTKYKGPVQIIRRTEDEVVCLREGQLKTNCGNSLLLTVLKSRFPLWFNERDDLKNAILSYVAMSEMERSTINKKNLTDVNRQALLLIRNYMRDIKSTHCATLPETFFVDVMKYIHLKN